MLVTGEKRKLSACRVGICRIRDQIARLQKIRGDGTRRFGIVDGERVACQRWNWKNI